ncbi:UDP-glycosyltransferase UGT5-like [Diorhabda carinulata]|uniref:UDP-glycosyltransferase UGT5-like n=1 Tax=Diorhabda carinulata TaxID=1163345 RepID=UPI0025A1BCA0|nr:UDP-glycosyltransferase UGT5-like [Diorhabda carinulata]
MPYLIVDSVSLYHRTTMRMLFIAVVLTSIYSVQGSKILMVFSLPSKSHFILGYALAKGLVKAGHDITMITTFTDKIPEGKGSLRFIPIENCGKKFEESEKTSGFNILDMASSSSFMNLAAMNFLDDACMRNAFVDPEVQKLMKSKEKFDVVLVESLMTDALIAFGCHFNAPVILLGSIGAAAWISNVVGNPTPPSYVPNTFVTFAENMTFMQRTENALLELLSKLNFELNVYPVQSKLVKEFFPNCPDIHELHKNVALVLSNSHESVNAATPKVPNLIDIGGFHISPGGKLPQDLQKILDNAKSGVVYFSLGSHLKPSQMKKDVKEAIIKVLSSLKQTVFCKWDAEEWPNKSDNIILGKWFPQQELLAHPNVKLFITHAGLLSLTETVYVGIPILALPVLGDQKINAAKAESLGIGLGLSITDLSEDTFRNAVIDILNNPKYSENVKRRSEILRDRPIPPLDLAIYWIEYVAKYKQVSHLRVYGTNLPWYQYYLIDVILFWNFVFIMSVYIVFKLFKRICCASKKDKLKKS